MTTKEEQNDFVARKAADDEIVKPYLIKSHVIRYGSKAKQSYFTHSFLGKRSCHKRMHGWIVRAECTLSILSIKSQWI